MSAIVGLSGRAGAGKDTVAYELARCGYRRFAFADPIKEIAYQLNPSIGTFELGRLVETMGWSEAKKVAGVRLFLQNLGQAARQELDMGVWVRPVMRAIDDHVKDGGKAVITDVRFPNEYDSIKKRGGVVVRVNRPGLPSDTHISESALDDHDFDVVIVNNGTLDDLYRKVERAATVWQARHAEG